ncbi:MAG: hypothetical protein U0Q55_14915 [Vicinamibacterales bacterium]
MSEGLFRKATIDKVSSPEQLDLMMRVTSPVGWLALTAMAAMITAVGVWSVMGTIPDLVDAQGTLFRGERRYDIKATMSGSLTALDVRAGSTVQAGQVIAKITRVQASDEGKAAADETRRAALEQIQANQITIAKNVAAAERYQAQIDTLQKQYDLQKQLVDQGIKAPKDLLSLQQQMDSLRSSKENLLSENVSLRARSASTAASNKVSMASESSSTEVKSTESGRVVEVIKSTGDKVNEGEALIRIERLAADTTDFCGGDVHALVYVPVTNGVKVKQGQFVRVSPAGIPKEEFGFILGKVEWVASYPASTADMSEKLKNDQLVKQFMGAGPVVETRICLEKNPSNPQNGFRWSSSGGPPQAIETGPCTVSMVVDERKPYTYVIPKVRKAIGI